MPDSLIELLMREKKDAAIGVKYRPGDSITHIEGACHSLVTPVVKALMQGDYKFAGTHIVPWFGVKDGQMLARPLIVSCLVQPDFEFDTIMYQLVKLEDTAIVGTPFDMSFRVPTAEEKRDHDARSKYDTQLKQHLVYYTVGTLPPKSTQTVEQGSIIECAPHDLSLKMLRKILILQLRGEFAAISRLAPQGFIYTWDPPAIFAQYLKASILNKLWADAMVEVAPHSSCKMVAFNDYSDKSIIDTLIARIKIPVISKAELFPDTLVIPESVQGCAIVIHNNSDGFGQNIETEAAYGSLDGAIGSASSTSASLQRDRADLLNDIVRV